MGNQAVSTGRLRSDTYTRYEREGEDGRYVTLEQNDYSSSFDERTNAAMRFRQQQRQLQPMLNEKKTIPVVFKYPAASKDKEAFLIGSFTNWKESVAMVKSDNDFVVILELPEGKHEYKFNIDGRWEYHNNEPSAEDSQNGVYNIVTVKKSDFEVMDALTSDLTLIDNAKPNVNRKQSAHDSDLARSPPGNYHSTWPPVSRDGFLPNDKPPVLPPHLLNIILNKDPADHYEPALLPEPNHVMLKHLYALSIRDGVIVLSTTSRYKQKFVTTCFYKPSDQ